MRRPDKAFVKNAFRIWDDGMQCLLSGWEFPLQFLSLLEFHAQLKGMRFLLSLAFQHKT